MSPIYQHTQAGTPIRIAISSVIVICLAVGLLVPSQIALLVNSIVVVVLVVALLLSHSLRMEVTRDTVTAVFGVGLMRFKFQVNDLESVMPGRTQFADGWGIHVGPKGWLYNVAGYDAVDVTKRDGSHVRFGTDDPKGLCAAIQKAIDRK